MMETGYCVGGAGLCEGVPAGGGPRSVGGGQGGK